MGTGEREPKNKGDGGGGGTQGKRGWEVGFLRWGEWGRKKENVHNIVWYFAIAKSTNSWEPLSKGWEPEVQNNLWQGLYVDPPVPLTP